MTPTERPLAVGEWVTCKGRPRVWRILHIDDEYVWLRCETESGPRRHVSKTRYLTRFERIADDTD